MYFDLHIDAEAGSTNTTASNKSTGSLESPANKGYAIYPQGGADLVEIVVSIWHDAHEAMSDKVFLGEVRLPMLNKQEQQAVSPSAWYYLQPRSMTHRGYVERVFEAIAKCAGKHFPSNREVRYSVVSGFIFLCFFAPAILGPKLFDLTTERLDAQTSRTLTLISKTIQSLGNLVSSRSSQQECKEVFTVELYKKFCTRQHVDAVKHFLEVISTPSQASSSVHPAASATPLQPVLLTEGPPTS
nr:GTPase-activating protein-like [Drosophila takahashii]